MAARGGGYSDNLMRRNFEFLKITAPIVFNQRFVKVNLRG